MKTKLTNCLNSILKLNYRMQGKGSPVLCVTLQPRALLNEVDFPNEAYYNEFKRQNQSLFDRGIVIEGKTTEKQAVANNKVATKQTRARAKKKADDTIVAIQNSADSVNAKLTIKEESTQ